MSLYGLNLRSPHPNRRAAAQRAERTLSAPWKSALLKGTGWALLCAITLGLSACARPGDRAQLPRLAVSPETVAALVIDLEELDTGDVDAWMTALDPQGVFTRQTDNVFWSLQAVHDAGGRKLLWMIETNTESTGAFFVQTRPSADPVELLGTLWDLGNLIEHPIADAEPALLEWQSDWWVMDFPGAWLPATQDTEHGLDLQATLSAHDRSPVRLAFDWAPSTRHDVIDLVRSPFAGFFLGPLVEPIAALHSGGIAFGHQGPSPRVRVLARFDSNTDAENAKQVAEQMLKLAKDEWSADPGLGLVDLGPHWEEREDALLITGQKLMNAMRWRVNGNALHLTLDKQFFGHLRHIRNLQTQSTDGAARLAWRE